MSQLKNAGVIDGNGQVANVVAYDDASKAAITLGGANGTKISNVAAGDLSATSTDAVNGAQLNATNQNVADLGSQVTKNTGDISNVQATLSDAVMYDSASHNSVTLGGANAPAPVALKNVADGVDNNDAVNVSQLKNAGVIDGNGQVANVVAYDDASKAAITLGGANGTKISNVAAGDLSATSTDAVNGSQLNATNQNVANLGSQVTKNAGDISNVQATLSDAVMYDSASHNSVTLGGANAAAPVALKNVADGVDNNDAVNVSQLKNAGVIDGNGQVANVVAYDDASKAAITLGGANGTKISNVAAGDLSATSTDAVNGSQLYATNQALDQINSNIANLDQGSVKYDRNDDGTVNYNSVTLGGGMSSGPVKLTNIANGTSTYDAVNFGQLSALQDRVTNIENKGLGNPYFNATDTDAGSGDAAVQHAAAPGAGAGSTSAGSGAIVAGDNGTAVGSNSSAADNAVAVGSGAVATSGSVAIGQGAQASAASAVALGNGSVADRDNTVSVGSATQQRQVTNVANGTEAKDAVNVSQLTPVVNGLGGGAAVNPDGSVTGPSYQLSGGTYSNVGDALTGLDNRVNATDKAINNVARGAYSGIAAATALTMIPDVDKDKTLSLGIGGGTYKGYQALAIGGTARITQNIKMRAGVGYSSGGTTAGVGASYQW
ncbi:hypothetical protein BTH42_28705 [Burkholderia sp. SRS-W-2-2016]|nr:hypothetical protein BTH42_28705 [Burkholderia sp. SRS-W-2-2016]